MKKFAQASALALLMATSFNVFSGPEAEVTGGKIAGTMVENLAVFRGIPYAEKLTRENRFRGPQPVQPWPENEILDASQYKPQCIQGRGNANNMEAEDCLYLNIATPKVLFESNSETERAASKRPVMVWIHGGAWQGGSAGKQFDPAPLVNEGDVILVKVEYRLGALGFAWHHALLDEPGELQGNYGLRDILQSLQWVQENIQQFGGDPNNVTIFGQSAGGWSVCDLMASKYASGLFHKAIIQSGGCPAWTKQQAQASASRLVEELGCDAGSKETIASCLRDRSAEKINRPRQDQGVYQSTVDISAVIDGELLTDNPLKVIEQGQYNSVPVMIGFNKNELPKIYYTGINNAMSYRTALEKVFYRDDDPSDILQQDIADIRSFYNRYRFDGVQDAISELHSDIVFRCNSRRIANGLITTSNMPVYRYELTVPSDPDASIHSMDIPYLFNQEVMNFPNMLKQIVEGFTVDQLEQQQAALQKTMLQSWTSFARNGKPVAQGRAEWQPYSNSNLYLLNANNPQMAASDGRNKGCDLIDGVAELRYQSVEGRWNFLR